MNCKKSLSVLLAMVLCLALSATAFAAETPSVGDPTPAPTTAPTQEPEVWLDANAGRNPSIGDLIIYNQGPLCDAYSVIDGKHGQVAIQSPGVSLTVSAKDALEAATAGYKWNLITFDMTLRCPDGTTLDGKLEAPAVLNLNFAFHGQVDFTDTNMAYTLLHYDTTTRQVEALPVSQEGLVTVTSLSPARLVANPVGSTPVEPEKPEETAKPAETAKPVAPVAPTAPTAPKTADRSPAAVLGLLAAVSGAGLVLTKKRK